MAENKGFSLFGFQLVKNSKDGQPPEQLPSFAPPQHDDGAITLETGLYTGQYVDMEGTARNEIEMITRYREMSMQPEIELAINEVVNEAIVAEDEAQTVKINVDQLDVDKNIKNKITEEFHTIIRLLNFNQIGHDVFRRWYVDGRLNYHIMIDPANTNEGIKELRYIDPRRLRKIREVEKAKDLKTNAEIVTKTQEYYIYQQHGTIGHTIADGVRIASSAIVNVNSGLMDARKAMVLSWLHKSIKPLNQVRMMEDATVIYKVSRAPDRRVFYVDVGNLPKTKAEQYLRDMMNKYRNKVVYDSSTGEVRDDRKFMSMLEDFWMPRRGETGKGTEIDTLPGGESLANMDNVIYFQKKLYQSLGVPVGRLLPSDGFSLGKSNEITREELAFMKFIGRLRRRFSSLFDTLMGVQLALRGVCTQEEWSMMKESIWYDFLKDNNFEELKDAELLNNRVAILSAVDPFVGRYFSGRWVQKNVLRMSDEEIKQMDKDIADETEHQSVLLPPVHPASPFFVSPEGQEADQQPNDDQKFGQAMTPGENDMDTAFGKLKVDEAALEPKTINTIKRVLQTRKTLNEQRKDQNSFKSSPLGE